MEGIDDQVKVFAMKSGRLVDIICELDDQVILYDIEKESFLSVDLRTLSVRDLFADSRI